MSMFEEGDLVEANGGGVGRVLDHRTIAWVEVYAVQWLDDGEIGINHEEELIKHKPKPVEPYVPPRFKVGTLVKVVQKRNYGADPIRLHQMGRIVLDVGNGYTVEFPDKARVSYLDEYLEMFFDWKII